ncbi:hypothetical protein [Sphingomonas sp. Leaf10]|uniref:hypothetical protein n=1 Tax=Sphingomonas sp. Leaf10 TaxID=1735676 RepID=UPI000ABD7DE8|nr:hypothetical protein [Sphingomonas sp. Leaf10]
MVDDIADRKGLTFAQAEGVHTLPQQLALREISPQCTALLWAIVYESFEKSLGHDSMYGGEPWVVDPWLSILRAWHVTREHRLLDEFTSKESIRLPQLKKIITSSDYIVVFDFLQYVIQHPKCPFGLQESIAVALTTCRAAYRIIDYMIVPIASDEEALALKAALKVAETAKPRGPYHHLKLAAAHLTAGAMADSVRESISAVEGAAKSIEPSADTLGPALHKLKSSIDLNPAMSSAFAKLYGWTSDAKGIRHANVFEGTADVTERDAMFMFGACASFVSYLLSATK